MLEGVAKTEFGRMPLPPPRPAPDCPAALAARIIPLPDPAAQLRQKLLSTLRDLQAHQPDALRQILVDAIGPMLVECVNDLIGDHEREYHRLAVDPPRRDGASACAPVDLDGLFDWLLEVWPADKLGDVETARAALDEAGLGLDDRDEEGLGIFEAFREGTQRCLLSADYLKEGRKYHPYLASHIRRLRWREHGQKTPGGNKAIGEIERQRRIRERAPRQAAIKPTVEAMLGAMPRLPTVKEEERSTLCRSIDNWKKAAADGDRSLAAWGRQCAFEIARRGGPEEMELFRAAELEMDALRQGKES